jgi:replication factor A1
LPYLPYKRGVKANLGKPAKYAAPQRRDVKNGFCNGNGTDGKVGKMRSKASPSEYLAFLSVKYGVDADKFFQALVSAEKNRRSTCGGLLIQCREKRKESVVFLITNGSRVVAQLSVSKEFLLRQGNPIKDLREASVLCRRLIKKDESSHLLQIKDLRIGMKSVRLKAEVVEIAEPTFVVTRFGNCASVANALVSDETGEIKLCLWNEQINSISVGDTVQLENARISAFRGERQARVGKNGILHSYRNVVLG